MVAKLLDCDYNIFLLFVLPFKIHVKLKLKLDDRVNVGSFTNSQTIGIWVLSTIGGVDVPSITQVYYHFAT